MKPTSLLLAACVLAALSLGVSLSLGPHQDAVDSRPPSAHKRKLEELRTAPEHSPEHALTIRTESPEQAASAGSEKDQPVGVLAPEQSADEAELQWRRGVLALAEPEQRALVGEMRAQIYSDQTKQELTSRVETGPYELVPPNGFDYEHWRREVYMLSRTGGNTPELRRARLERHEAPDAYRLLDRVIWLEDQISAQ
jgi:hypothetical protein